MKVLLLVPEMILMTMSKETPGARRNCFQSSLQNQDTQLKNFNIKEIVLRLNTGLRGGQYVQGILLSLVFLRLFKHEESPLSSTISLNMSESSLRFIKSSWLTSSLGESWWASKSELIKATMCSNSSTATWWELILPYRSSCTSTWWPSTCSQASSKLF